MFPSFTGNYKKTRNIDLSNKQGSTRLETIRIASQERDARELYRTKIKSAVKIQAFIRGRKDANRSRTRLRALFDQKMFTGIPMILDLVSIMLLVTRSKSIKNGASDLQRVKKLCQYLPLKVDNVRWMHMSKPFNVLVLNCLILESSFDQLETGTHSLHEYIDRIIESPVVYTEVRRADFFVHISKYVSNLINVKVESQKYDELRWSFAKCNKVLEMGNNQFRFEYMKWILTLRNIPSLLTSSFAPLKELCCDTNSISKHVTSSEAVFILCNILSIHNSPESRPVIDLSVFLRILTSLIDLINLDRSLFAKYYRNQSSEDEDNYAIDIPKVSLEMDKDSPVILEEYRAILTITSKSFLVAIWIQYKKEMLSPTLECPGTEAAADTDFFITFIISLLKFRKGVRIGSDIEDGITDTLQHLQGFFEWLWITCLNSGNNKLFSSLLRNEPNQTSGPQEMTEILFESNMAYSNQYLYKNCDTQPLHLDSTCTVRQILCGTLNLTQDDKFSLLIDCIYLFCAIYSRRMMTFSDDEFFKSLTFSVDNIGLLSLVLKVIVFEMHTNESALLTVNGIGGVSYDARKCYTYLLKQIYYRNVRHPFTIPSHWTTSLINVSDFIQMVKTRNSDTENEDGQPKSLYSSPVSQRMKNCSTILTEIPFMISFESRIEIFRAFIQTDRINLNLENHLRFVQASVRASIRRDHVFEDGEAILGKLGDGLKKRVAIEFIDPFGSVEAGIDGGGVFKEFMTLCFEEAFSPKFGLFEVTSDQLLYPSNACTQMDFRSFEFLGRVVGKAIYESILIDSSFAHVFLKKWLGQQSYLDDLLSLDGELYSGMMFLKTYKGDIHDLSLTFSVSQQTSTGVKNIDLIPNGCNIAVNLENRMKYVYLVANYQLNVKTSRQCGAFFRGLKDIIDPAWLRIFNHVF